MKGIHGTLILLLLVLSGCNRPESEESFILEEDSDFGIYSFTLDMSDSLELYDVWLYTKTDAQKGMKTLPLQVMWTSPSGRTYSEQVDMRIGSRDCDKELYRKDLVPVEYGLWNLAVAFLNDAKGVRGMGVILKRKDGTRQTP